MKVKRKSKFTHWKLDYRKNKRKEFLGVILGQFIDPSLCLCDDRIRNKHCLVICTLWNCWSSVGSMLPVCCLGPVSVSIHGREQSAKCPMCWAFQACHVLAHRWPNNNPPIHSRDKQSARFICRPCFCQILIASGQGAMFHRPKKYG